jgi:hypothetical protein
MGFSPTTHASSEARREAPARLLVDCSFHHELPALLRLGVPVAHSDKPGLRWKEAANGNAGRCSAEVRDGRQVRRIATSERTRANPLHGLRVQPEVSTSCSCLDLLSTSTRDASFALLMYVAAFKFSDCHT